MTKTQLLTGARRQKVVVEYRFDGGPEWWVMFNDGAVEVFDDSGHAMKAIRRAAARRNVSLTLTMIEWRNAPTGFVPPTGA